MKSLIIKAILKLLFTAEERSTIYHAIGESYDSLYDYYETHNHVKETDKVKSFTQLEKLLWLTQ